MRPLFHLRGQIGKLRQCDLKIGQDGFARTGLTPFVAATGRSQPSGKEFMFALPRWMRFLIAAPPGYAVAQLDWSGQEIAIAAGKSGDKNLREAYESGDAHLFAGQLFGLIPKTADAAETHAAERDMVKPVMFGSNYGASDAKLAQLAKIPLSKARELRMLHRRTFATFWAWIGQVQEKAYREGKIETGLGWAMRVPPQTRATTLLDWPMQAIGNEMMRHAACAATDAGITLCCTVHDAFILIAPVAEIKAKVDQMRNIMNAASRKILGFKCDVHSDIFEHPAKFFDKKGAKMQATVEACLAELEGIEPPPPSPKRAKRAMQLGDGATLHPYVAKIIDNAEARIKTDEDPARALFIGANEIVKRANGHCIPDLDAVLSTMQQAAVGEGVAPAEAEKIIRSAKRNEEIAGVPTTTDSESEALSAATKFSSKNSAAIKKGLLYG